MDIKLIIILATVLVINIISFFVVVLDKDQARDGKRRINEGTLFFWAIMFGGIGIYLGMFTARHKTRKWYFYFGIPLIIIQNICCLYLLYQFLENIF